ncbi:VanZ family protein [Hymenobacter sp. RP-2-7]|uniref:VanZ family protein n=1 Tax=Hymenobacter polaris TaxID=2682546 RepID=A0A7Y0AFQ5_9BACT|nr:VanZ family protein [Hymenobacter polaris]NML66506.1 VanZ family protein [Hymenobacter polaris]
MKLLQKLFSSPYPTLVWTITILVLTLTPAADMPETPAWKLLSFDTAAHAGVFGLLALLAYPWVQTWALRPRLLVLLGGVALGALIEVLQYAMHLGRQAEWSDLLSDSIGVVLALLVIGVGRRRLAASASLLLLAALGATAQPATPSAPDAPDLARARRTIAELAAPSLHGRGYVQGGEHLAAAYLRGRLRQLGLQPLAPDYTQPFTLDVNTFPNKATLNVSSITGNSPAHKLHLGTDFIAAPESAGTLGKPLTALAIRLDSSIFSQPSWQDALLKEAADALGSTRRSEGRLAKPFLVLAAHDEARLAKLPLPLQHYLDSLPNRVLLVPKLTASLAPTVSPAIRIESLEKLPVWQFGEQHQRFALLNLQLDAQLLRNYQTQNLAAVVRGSTQPDSFLVVSAHYDHLGMMGKDTYFPGANDNASGVALLLELAAHYARPENRPACSVAFLLSGAEEAGLIGSSYFVQHPLLPLPRIKFLVNLDLLGTGEEGATIVNGRVYEAAYQRLVALNDTHHYLPKLTARGRAANSDHFPFSEAGVPAFFMYTRGGSQTYHDVRDQPAALSLAGFAGAYGLVRDFLDQQGARPEKSPGR